MHAIAKPQGDPNLAGRLHDVPFHREYWPRPLSTVRQNVVDVQATVPPWKAFVESNVGRADQLDPFHRTERPPLDVAMQNDALVHDTS